MRVRIFKNKDVLYQMLQLRRAGLTLEALAEIFDCDFSTIYHHCTQYNIHPDRTLWITPNLIGKMSSKHILYIEIPNIKNVWYIDSIGERINKGKSYEEYLDEYNKRNAKSTI